MSEASLPDALRLPRLEARLRESLPERAFEIAVAGYSIDGALPSLAIKPSSAEEVAAVLKTAADNDGSVVPWGGGTQQALGSRLQRYDVALDLRGLDKVIEYEPADLTVTVEAGMPLSKLQAELSKSGQWLPLDPPLPPEATIGGILATNASGPSRHRYGSARDLLIGITFALPNGDIAKSGGRVVKNVAGYDMGKLQIGALGTLGVITQATFKVAPLPQRVDRAAASGEMGTIMSINARLADALLSVGSLVLLPEASGWRLDVQFAGGSAAVERSVREFGTIVSAAGGRLVSAKASPESAAAYWSEAPLLLRASVAPTSVGQVSEAFRARGAVVRAYPGAGIVYGSFRQTLNIDRLEAITYLRKLCVESGRGALVLERAPLELKLAAGVWGEPRGDFELMKRIKAEMDPANVLNPGRYIGNI